MKTIKKFGIAFIIGILLISCNAQPVASPVTVTETTEVVQEAQPTPAPVELTFALMQYAPELEGWKAVIEEANKLLAVKNIHINTQEVASSIWAEYTQKVVTQIAAGSPPDIGLFAESQVPMMMSKGYLTDITDVVQSFDESKYFVGTWKGTAYRDGKYYGIPSGVYHMVMYYNKDLFDKAGLPYPSADWNNSITFDQVRTVAKLLTSGEGVDKIFGFHGGPYMGFIGMYSVSNGGKNVVNQDGTCALTDPVSIGVYKWFDAMLQVDKSMPRPSETALVSAFDNFLSGRIAMLVDGSWMHGVYNGIQNFKVGIAAVPSGKGHAYSSVFTNAWVIPKGSKHEAEAKEALRAIFSVEAQTAMAKAGIGGMPVSREVFASFSDTYFSAMFTDTDKQAFIDGLDHTLPVPYNENYDEIDVKANAVMDEWLLGKITPEQYAANVCDIWNQITSK